MQAVKEFLETAKEEFEEKWKNPVKVSIIINVYFFLFSFSVHPWLVVRSPTPFFGFNPGLVQDFLDSAKKDFEERWSNNAKVSPG